MVKKENNPTFNNNWKSKASQAGSRLVLLVVAYYLAQINWNYYIKWRLFYYCAAKELCREEWEEEEEEGLNVVE